MQRCAHGRINAQTMLVITTPTPNQEQEFADTYGFQYILYSRELHLTDQSKSSTLEVRMQ